MKNTIEYKGFVGSVEIEDEKHKFVGEVINIKDSLVLYEGENYKEFVQDFHNAVDDYIEYKKKKKEEIVNPFKGSFNVRVNPEVHKDAVIYAKQNNVSLNKLVEISICEKIYRKLKRL